MNPRKIQRLRQPVPEELRDSILSLLRSKFYRLEDGTIDAKKFAQDRRLLLAWVVLWPASWLWKRGVTIHGEAYRQIFTRVFIQAAAHATSKVKYRPAYLRHVIQTHFRLHGEEIYEQAKSIRSEVDHALLIAGQARQPAPDPVAALAAAQRLVAAPKRPLKARKAPPQVAINLELKLD